jgi:orotidine-5'-phosphate decarboxylase
MKRKNLKARDRLIVSLDVAGKREVISLCSKISGKVSTLKLGLELMYRIGPEIIGTVKSFGYRVMLDAKLFDIPNTVNGALRAIGKLGVNMVTIHTLGGKAMLAGAVKILKEQSENKIRPLLLGVTILTSLDDSDLDLMGFRKNHLNSVLDLACFAEIAGLDGVICSAGEVESVREKTGSNFYIATPGIRLPEDAVGDQKRVSTPRDAVLKGADFIVVGRPITRNKDIGGAVDRYLEEIEGALRDD